MAEGQGMLEEHLRGTPEDTQGHALLGGHALRVMPNCSGSGVSRASISGHTASAGGTPVAARPTEPTVLGSHSCCGLHQSFLTECTCARGTCLEDGTACSVQAQRTPRP